MANRLAFSTLGCPEWNMDRILQAALEYGYGSVELRGYLSEMDLPRAQPFTPEHRAETRQRFADAGVSFCCVSSSGIVSDANNDHVARHCELAYDLACPLVRIFGGGLPSDLPHGEGMARAAAALRRFGDLAQQAGVSLVLETHDAFSTGAQVAELLALAEHPAVFSLWDLHHPYRQGEMPEETFQHLGSTLRHVHIKDGRGGTYTLMGEGDVPLCPMLDLILDSDYSGVISLEWEKRWKPGIAPPEVAFPQYAQALRSYLGNLPV